MLFLFLGTRLSPREHYDPLTLRRWRKLEKKQLSWKNRKKFEIEFISIPLTQESQYLFKQY